MLWTLWGSRTEAGGDLGWISEVETARRVYSWGVGLRGRGTKPLFMCLADGWRRAGPFFEMGQNGLGTASVAAFWGEAGGSKARVLSWKW